MPTTPDNDLSAMELTVQQRDTPAVPIGLKPLALADVVAVARHDALVQLTVEALDSVRASRTAVEVLAAQETPLYGVSTGFGALNTVRIPVADRERLQRSLIRSHAAGMGDPV